MVAKSNWFQPTAELACKHLQRISASKRMTPTTVQVISGLLGWTYMLCWAASFYLQPILNIRRKTTLGFSIDFALLNILGMSSYAIYNLALYSWPTIRHEYAQRYPSHPDPTVRLNDIAYALNGAILTAFIYSQFYPKLWGFTPIKGLRCSRWCLSLFWGCVVTILLAISVVLFEPDSMSWSFLDVVSHRRCLRNCASSSPAFLEPPDAHQIQADRLNLVSLPADIPPGDYQVLPYPGKVRTTGLAELQTQVNPGPQHLAIHPGPHGRGLVSGAAVFRLGEHWELVSRVQESGQVCAGQHHYSVRSCIFLPAHGSLSGSAEGFFTWPCGW